MSRFKAINYIVGLARKTEMWRSILNLWTIFAPKISTVLVHLIIIQSILRVYAIWLLFFVQDNCLEFIWANYHTLFLSQLTLERDSSSNESTKLYNLSKLWMSDLVNHKNNSFSHILKRIGPNIDGCDTSKKKECQECYKYYQVWLVFTFSFLFFQVSTEKSHRIKTNVKRV